jgi:hypothetical protein
LAHFVYYRAKHLRRFNSLRDQHRESAQGGLFGGELAILRVQRDMVDRLVESLGWKFLGG